MKQLHQHPSLIRFSVCVALTCAALPPHAQAATPAELLSGYTAPAGKPADAARGQQLFTNRQGFSRRAAGAALGQRIDGTDGRGRKALQARIQDGAA